MTRHPLIDATAGTGLFALANSLAAAAHGVDWSAVIAGVGAAGFFLSALASAIKEARAFYFDFKASKAKP